MKKMIFAMIALVSATSAASPGWKESVTCAILRTSVDDGTQVLDKVSGIMKMDGPHDVESGDITLVSKLAPAYKIQLSLLATGRGDTLSLKTTRKGEIKASSSLAVQQQSSITNSFVSADGDYQMTVECSTKTIGF